MTDKSYIEKVTRLDNLLKSQKVYDYMMGLMAVRVKNRLPQEEKKRQNYDKSREISLGSQKANLLILNETQELTSLLKSSFLVQQYALLKMSAEYAYCASQKDLEQNLKRVSGYGSYPTRIGQQKIKIPANKIRTLEY